MADNKGDAGRRGRRPHPEELEKHTILVPAALWRWARSKQGGAGSLIRALLIAAQLEDEDIGPYAGDLSYILEPRRQLSVSTPSGNIGVTQSENGVAITLAGVAILQYVYDNRRKCPVIIIPTGPSELLEERSNPSDDFSALGLEPDEDP